MNRYKIFIGKKRRYLKTVTSKHIEDYIDKKYGREWSYTIDKTKKEVILDIKNNFMISG